MTSDATSGLCGNANLPAFANFSSVIDTTFTNQNITLNRHKPRNLWKSEVTLESFFSVCGSPNLSLSAKISNMVGPTANSNNIALNRNDPRNI